MTMAAVPPVCRSTYDDAVAVAGVDDVKGQFCDGVDSKTVIELRVSVYIDVVVVVVATAAAVVVVVDAVETVFGDGADGMVKQNLVLLPCWERLGKTGKRKVILKMTRRLLNLGKAGKGCYYTSVFAAAPEEQHNPGSWNCVSRNHRPLRVSYEAKYFPAVSISYRQPLCRVYWSKRYQGPSLAFVYSNHENSSTRFY